MSSSGLEPTRSLFGASFGLAALLAAVLTARGEPHAGTCLAVLLALVVAGLLLQIRVPRISRALLVVAILNGLLLVPELGLRVTNFHFASGVRFGYPTPEDFQEFEPDADLFWKLPADSPHVNSLGFFGPEPAPPDAAGTHRVLFLGDSCLQLGFPDAVPDLVAQVANADRSPDEARFESINLSMSGYSSHQGLRVAELLTSNLEPELVVVSFGWNDHWRAYGEVDHRKTINVSTEGRYRRSRLLQGLRWLAVQLGRSGDAQRIEQNRVPIERYRENLAALAALFAERQVPVVFVTAPSAHGERGVPEYLVRRGFAPDAAAVVREHQDYVDVTREVARVSGASLLDLAVIFDAQEDARAVFVDDGIHFNESGRGAAARHIAAFLEDADLAGLRGERAETGAEK